MPRQRKAPAGGTAGALRKDYHVGASLTLDLIRAQVIAVRFGMPIEVAGTIAALAFGGGANG